MPFYKGSIHIHSNWSSDGALSLESLKKAYTSRGFHFVMLSDHLEDFTSERYRKMVSACQVLSSENFLLVPGLEFHSESVALFGLMSYPGSGMPLIDLLQTISPQGSFNAFVHPTNFGRLPSEKVISKLHALEVWNVRYDGSRFPSYRNLKFWHRLSEHFPLIPIFGIDFHNKEGIGTTWIEVELEKLSRQNLLGALKNAQFKLFARNKHWQMDHIGNGAKLQIFGYHCFRLISLAIYRKIKNHLPEIWVKQVKGIVNGRS